MDEKLTAEQIQNFEFLPLGKDGCETCKNSPLYYCKACERKIEAVLSELDKRLTDEVE